MIIGVIIPKEFCQLPPTLVYQIFRMDRNEILTVLSM